MNQTPMLVIFAGGTSSRMWPFREKLLLRFGDSPLLLDQLRRYQALGFDEAVVITHPQNRDDIAGLTAQMTAMQIEVVVQPEAIGQGDALLQVNPVLVDRPHMPIYAVQAVEHPGSSLQIG